MGRKIFVHAVSVHQGGGRNLLEALLHSLDEETQFILTLDERMDVTLVSPSNVEIRRVKPSIFHRVLAELWLWHRAAHDDRVLCFGSLPPLFRLKAFTLVFVQNRYLVDDVSLAGFPVWVQFRITIERLWFRFALLHANKYLVQTPSMESLLESKLNRKISVAVVPFASGVEPQERRNVDSENNVEGGFFYVASGEPHKNHRRLLDAWSILAKEGIYPQLFLTLDGDAFPDLLNWILQKSAERGLLVRNLGCLSHDQVLQGYRCARALIYPSTFESLGLPLIEARRAGLPILASELDYVRDLLDPDQTFDPDSAVSISRAVKRFLGVLCPVLPIRDADEFMAHVLGKDD